MAGTVKVNTVQLGDSATATQNFTLKTNVDGTAILHRGNDGSNTQDLIRIGTDGYLSMVANGYINVRNYPYGAKGDGSTDDTTAIQAAVTAAVAAGKAVYFPSGTYLITSTITVTGKWSFYGEGRTSVLKTNTTNIPYFTFNINTTSVTGWVIDNLYFEGPTSSNTSSCALLFSGDSTAFVQYGSCRATSYGFNAFMKCTKATRTTGFGQESNLSWNLWDVVLINANNYGFWYTLGSGTGNVHRGIFMTLNANAAAFSFEGSGCVVGDIVIEGHFGCQDSVSGGIGINIGASTVYRAQIQTSKCQWDANVNRPFVLSSTGAVKFTNFNISGNNLGGSTVMGTNLIAMSNSYIEDRDGDFRKAGKAISTNATGAQSTNIFKITTGAYGACRFKVYANGLVGGVNACSSYAEYELKDTAGTITVNPLDIYTGVTNGFAFTTSISTNTLTIAVTYTPASAGSVFNTSIEASGDFYKIERL